MLVIRLHNFFYIDSRNQYKIKQDNGEKSSPEMARHGEIGRWCRIGCLGAIFLRCEIKIMIFLFDSDVNFIATPYRYLNKNSLEIRGSTRDGDVIKVKVNKTKELALLLTLISKGIKHTIC